MNRSSALTFRMLLAFAFSILMISSAFAQTPQEPIKLSDTATLAAMGIKVTRLPISKAPLEVQQAYSRASAAKQAAATSGASGEQMRYRVITTPGLITVPPLTDWDNTTAAYFTLADDVWGQSFLLPQDVNPIGETQTGEGVKSTFVLVFDSKSESKIDTSAEKTRPGTRRGDMTKTPA